MTRAETSTSATPTRRRRRWIEPALLAALAGLAVGLRAWQLYTVPVFGEANENFLALGILDGHFPLTNQNPHIGALSVYLVAAFLAALGRHWWVARLVPLAAGSATVLLTYALGRRTGGRRSAILGALLLATSWYHVVFTSRVAWANSLTPLFTTAFLAALAGLLGARRGRAEVLWALATGLLFGLALQTHLEASVLLPVIPLALAWRAGRPAAWLARPAPYALAAGALTGYANMAYFNLASNFASVRFAFSYPEYAIERSHAPLALAGNYARAILQLARAMLGYYQGEGVWGEIARRPLVWIFWGLLAAGMAASLRARRGLVPLAFASAFALIPFFNRGYTLDLARYLGLLFPLASLLIARGALALAAWRPFGPGRGRGAPFEALAALLLAAVAVFPVTRLRPYFDWCAAELQTSEPYFRLRLMADQTGAEAGRRPLVFMDHAVWNSEAFLHYLREDGVTALPFDWDRPGRAPLDDARWPLELARLQRADPARPILAGVRPDACRGFLARMPVAAELGGVMAASAEGHIMEAFRLFRLALPGEGAWVNPELVLQRALAARAPEGEAAGAAALRIELARDPGGAPAVSAALANPGPDRTVDLYAGYRRPDGAFRFAPAWEAAPAPAPVHLAAGAVSGPAPLAGLDPARDPPGRYTFFALACEPGSLVPAAPAAVLELELEAGQP